MHVYLGEISMSSSVECPVFAGSSWRRWWALLSAKATLTTTCAKFLGCVPMVLYLELCYSWGCRTRTTAAASLLLPHFNHGPCRLRFSAQDAEAVKLQGVQESSEMLKVNTMNTGCPNKFWWKSQICAKLEFWNFLSKIFVKLKWDLHCLARM